MNNKKVTVCVAIIILSTTAVAAATPHPSFNWTGFYIGGFLGGAHGTKITSTEPLRVDNDTFWFRPFHNSFRYNSNPSFIGGGTVGYNWKIDKIPYLVGLEGEYGYLNEQGRTKDPNQLLYATIPNNNVYNSSVNSISIGSSSGFAMVGGRIGYIQDRSLFYVKSGAVFTRSENQYTSAKTDSTSSTGIAFLNIHGNNHRTGFGVGGGIEYALPFKGFSNISAKIEYLYLGIDKTQLAYGHCSCDFLWRTSEHIRGINTAKFGINYKFA